eukprot:TRINITY_DN437_c0_g1_i2.p1 TRINITY_DN437_c0_g1~~TRINITY_DN437_c0_g1_i2.p1  ORF type:complete len:397 (+),score=107.43 TRINITY_DN437_c0_g1_i2:215-1405(+)
MPTIAGSIVVRFDYDATADDEVTIRVGEIGQTLNKVSDDWWFVQFGSRSGLIPSNYVSEVLAEAIAEFDYTAQDETEVNFNENDTILVLEKLDADWWIGQVKNMQGMFPSAYVKEIPLVQLSMKQSAPSIGVGQSQLNIHVPPAPAPAAPKFELQLAEAKEMMQRKDDDLVKLRMEKEMLSISMASKVGQLEMQLKERDALIDKLRGAEVPQGSQLGELVFIANGAKIMINVTQIASAASDSKEVCCPICREDYVGLLDLGILPHSLNCGHSVCSECLTALAKTNADCPFRCTNKSAAHPPPINRLAQELLEHVKSAQAPAVKPPISLSPAVEPRKAPPLPGRLKGAAIPAPAAAARVKACEHCTPEQCGGFVPNQFKPHICGKCRHNKNTHAGQR